MPLRCEQEGWYLPKGDTYFAQFVQGPAPKLNGFQREHLHEAFKHVKQWRTAIDVGAHVGFWTFDMAKKFDLVYAFEPAIDCYDCLVKNVAEFPNVTPVHFAVGNYCGRAMVKEDPHKIGKDGRPVVNTGSRYIVPELEPFDGSVPMLTIDSFCFQQCDLLKIDVEGFELQVLQGAQQLISDNKPVIIMECDKKFEGRYGVEHGTAELLLRSAGYKCVAHMRPDKVFVA